MGHAASQSSPNNTPDRRTLGLDAIFDLLKEPFVLTPYRSSERVRSEIEKFMFFSETRVRRRRTTEFEKKSSFHSLSNSGFRFRFTS